MSFLIFHVSSRILKLLYHNRNASLYWLILMLPSRDPNVNGYFDVKFTLYVGMCFYYIHMFHIHRKKCYDLAI